jgi:ubiquinone/menaquinone biosynthesis C-methylase UbiE
MAKDLFSERANLYAQYRPTYPEVLFEYILSFVKERKMAWDCATGNGQAAVHLAQSFDQVEATDISEAQLRNAVLKENIHYQVSAAEATPFNDNTFDLITIATAYHWLDWDAFHKEATRVGKPGCVIAAWATYTMRLPEDELQQLYFQFYREIVGSFWEPERRYVDDQYETVAFNFQPLPIQNFEIELEWTKQQFKGYLETWSATQKYMKTNGASPLDIIEVKLNALWKDEEKKKLAIPLCLRLGRVVK